MLAFQEINEIIASLIDLTGIGVCFYDLENFYHFDSDGKREHVGHYCELCKNVRLLQNGRTLCERSDKAEALQLARSYREPFFFKCHIGLCELVIPIIDGDHLRGVVFLGQCQTEGDTSPEEIGDAAARLGGSSEIFAEMARSLPTVSRSHLLSMGKIVQLYFKNRTVESFASDKSEEFIAATLAERISVYICRNYMKEISPHRIADHFFINQSYMARIFRLKYQCTVTDYINRIRCENAAKLLIGTRLPIHSIALNVGYSDTSYFARIFSRLYGCKPSAFKDRGKDSSSAQTKP